MYISLKCEDGRILQVSALKRCSTEREWDDIENKCRMAVMRAGLYDEAAERISSTC